MKIERKGLYRKSFTITVGKFQQTLKRSSCNKLGSFSRPGKTIPFATARCPSSKRVFSKRNRIKADERPFSLGVWNENKKRAFSFVRELPFPSIDDKPSSIPVRPKSKFFQGESRPFKTQLFTTFTWYDFLYQCITMYTAYTRNYTRT